MKKHIKGIVAYSILIIVVLVYVFLRVGIIFSLTKIMPEYRTQIYSLANMLNYDLNTIKSAKNQINRQIDKIRNDIYQEKDYYEKGLRKILDLNEQNLSSYISSFSEIKKNEYDNLSKTDYIDYIKSIDNDYKDNLRQNSLSIYVYPLTAVDKGLYYELSADFYKAISIDKKTVSNLGVGEKYKLQYPIGTSSEALELEYQGDKKFKYDFLLNVVTEENKNEEQTISHELILKELNKNEYAVFDSNNQRLEVYDKSDKVCILKDAMYGSVDGPNFLYMANYILVLEARDVKYGDLMRFGDFITEVLNNIASSSDADNDINNKDMDRLFNSIYANYVVYDNKGYITDLYSFTGN